MDEFFPSSITAVQKASTPVKCGGWNVKYPWRAVPVGKSFTVKLSEIKEGSLRSLAYKTGKRMNARFIVVIHGDVYEVARVA